MSEDRGNGHHARRDWFWLCAVEGTTGIPFVDGPYDTEGEAQRVGFERLKEDNFEVMKWPTVDKNRATAMWRHARYMRGEQLPDVLLKRTKHKI